MIKESAVAPRKHVPNIRSRRLRAELVRLREEQGIPTERVAEELEWSRARVSRIETGKVLPRTYDVRAMLDLYETFGDRREQILQLARDARRTNGWWYSYLDVMPEGFDMFVALESEAASIRTYEPQVIPGLLQTGDYARAVFDARESESHEELDRLVAVRLERQRLLVRDCAPEYRAILNEAALHSRIGSLDVMERQLRCLIKAAERANTTIQVVPAARGAHPAMSSGPFVILGFPDHQDPDIVRLETLRGGIYAEGMDDAKLYTQAYSLLRTAALSPDESRALIERVADGYSQLRKECPDDAGL